MTAPPHPPSPRGSLRFLSRGAPPGTGIPRLDAADDFARARRHFRAHRIVRALGLRGWEPRWPSSLDDGTVWPLISARPCLLPVAAIVGTLEPTRDFDAGFRPATNRIEARWRRVAEAHRSGRALPPINAIEQPEGYYIIDGRHRVSVARALGLTHIDAWLAPLTARATRSPEARSNGHAGTVWF